MTTSAEWAERLSGYVPEERPMRTRAHYIDMLDRNPNATIGFTLAAKMIRADKVPSDDLERETARYLVRKYGEILTNADVRAEMRLAE